MIPRTVHRLWLGGPEPDWMAGFADTWRQPGWELRQWTDDNVGELFPLVNQDIYDRVEEIAPDHVGQLRSDVLRYEILHRLGGVWVDADFECLRPIDPLLDGVECFAAWEAEGVWVNNAIVGATPGHPFIGALVEGLAANVERRQGCKPNKLTGPQYLTPVYREHASRVTVLAKALFYPYTWAEVDRHRPGDDFPDAYAVHHWANRRREKGIPC